MTEKVKGIIYFCDDPCNEDHACVVCTACKCQVMHVSEPEIGDTIKCRYCKTEMIWDGVTDTDTEATDG